MKEESEKQTEDIENLLNETEAENVPNLRIGMDIQIQKHLNPEIHMS